MNQQQTFGVQFFIRHKSTRSDLAGIYIRLTVNTERLEISTKLKCPVYLWDSSKEKVRSDREFSSSQINKYITANRAKIMAIYQDLHLKDEMITADIIKNRFLGIKEEGRTLKKLLEYHKTSHEDNLSDLTKFTYRATRHYLLRFLKEVKKTEDIYLKQINYRFITDFEAFLRKPHPTKYGTRRLGHNTIMKHLCRLRSLVNFAIKLDWMTDYPFKSYRMSYKQTKVRYLTQKELERIESRNFSVKRLQLTRDLFLFSCYTGLSYVDITKLTPDNITIGIDGKNWIFATRKKTENALRIPILPMAEVLIEKYKDSPEAQEAGTLFPKMTNQRLNGYLKEIADINRIKKKITFHMARHTFATTVTLSNGVPIETVSKILGHHRIATTQVYAQVVENKVSQDMNQLQLKLTEKNNDNKKEAK